MVFVLFCLHMKCAYHKADTQLMVGEMVSAQEHHKFELLASG